MARRLNVSDAAFEAEFAALLDLKREMSVDVDADVAQIIARVREEGDGALFDLTRRFDRFDAAGRGLRVSEDEIDAAMADVAPETLAALETARARIAAYHERQMPSDARYTDEMGVELGWRWTPVAAAGLYVPGGLASYPSSVLMNAVAAKTAGVGRLVMTAPTPDGAANPVVLAAARLSGVDEIYRVGGAQAVAALAYGTTTIRPVDVVVGPGNAYVAAAKRRVFGRVGIDSIAGPSEILVVADAGNDPEWIAADLLSQAEHDAAAQSVLMTDDAAFADAVAASVDRQLKSAPRADIAGASWRNNSAVIVIGDFAQAGPLIDRIAPEHLELAVADPEALLATFSNAGAVFMGRWTPEAVGDYVAGPNHVLPTARAARYASGLSVLDFMKRTSLIKCSEAGLKAIGPAAARLADAEGLAAHALSVRIRIGEA